MNELEIRAQAAYGVVAQKLTRAMDEIANLTAEVAVKEAQLQELRDELAALKKPAEEKPPEAT